MVLAGGGGMCELQLCKLNRVRNTLKWGQVWNLLDCFRGLLKVLKLKEDNVNSDSLFNVSS